jgi:hypothetical protein
LSYQKIEDVASRVRKILAPGNRTAALAGIALLESLDKYKVSVGNRSISLTYAVEAVPPGVEAHTRYDSENDEIVIALSETTYAALENDDPRSKFTLTHEIGHAVLHPAELVRLSQIPHTQVALLRGINATHPMYKDTEWQANAFASALLMPVTDIRKLGEKNAGVLSTVLVQRHFGVSYTAAQCRLGVLRRYSI